MRFTYRCSTACCLLCNLHQLVKGNLSGFGVGSVQFDAFATAKWIAASVVSGTYGSSHV